MLQATADPAIVRQLESLEEQLVLTWKNRDCAGWGGLLADDWTVTHINARVITKVEAIEMCRTGPAVTSSVDRIAVRIYGDTAIVTGRTKATASSTPPQTVVLRFTDVVVQRNGRWIVVASHATQIQDAPQAIRPSRHGLTPQRFKTSRPPCANPRSLMEWSPASFHGCGNDRGPGGPSMQIATIGVDIGKSSFPFGPTVGSTIGGPPASVRDITSGP